MCGRMRQLEQWHDWKLSGHFRFEPLLCAYEGLTVCVLVQPIKDILIPKFREHSAEELQARADLLTTQVARSAKRKASQEPKIEPEAPKAQDLKDVDMEAESSSSEDTSDEAFHRTHTVEEEKERAKYEGDYPMQATTQMPRRDKRCIQNPPVRLPVMIKRQGLLTVESGPDDSILHSLNAFLDAHCR